jgi:microcystin-dependent protein
MATRKIVPRANGEGAIGDNTAGAEKYWGGGFFNTINGANAIEMAAFNDGLQWKASTAYAKGSIVFTSGLSAGMYLECLVDGTSNTDKFAIPSSIVPNTTTITDNTVTWIVREICSTQIDDSYSRKPNTTYLRGEIRFLYGELPVGWFLECSVAGVSGSGDLTITTPAEGSTVTDGTVTWVMKKMGTGSGGGDGVPLGAILPLAHNSTIPAGYLLCDGAAYSRTMFPDLFAAIGTTYGAGDGSTTFNLPNYSDGKFPEGSTVAGTVKQPGLPNITGTFNADNYPQPSYATGAFERLSGTFTTRSSSTSSGNYYEDMRFDASLSNSIYGASNTVQPYSCTVRYIIKAYDGVTPTPSEADISNIFNEIARLQLPTGTIIPTANDVASPGFLICDGSEVSRETYSVLFNAIGTKYGAGDGSTTFNLPNSDFVADKSDSAPVYYHNLNNDATFYFSSTETYQNNRLGPNLFASSDVPSYTPSQFSPQTAMFADLSSAITTAVKNQIKYS